MLTPGLMDAAKETIGMHATYLIIVMLSIVFSWLMSLTVEYPFIRIYKKPVLAKQEQFLLAKR